MAKEKVAVVGIGQTHHQATRGDVSMGGLVREAALEALAEAGMTWADIDAVVIGKAPDFFEGVMMPELYLADALGAVGKPMLRVHTAGSVGGSTAIVASQLVAAGIHGFGQVVIGVVFKGRHIIQGVGDGVGQAELITQVFCVVVFGIGDLVAVEVAVKAVILHFIQAVGLAN